MAALTELQDRILRRFFARRSEFFLTGGAALVGFHLHHRETHDLDLFTTESALDDGEQTLREVAVDLELQFDVVQRSPDFRRFLLKTADEGVVVDLVRDEAPQLLEKLRIDGVIVDSAQEILANKLCALLSRVEIRDLVDVAKLDEAGHDAIAAIDLAQLKDGGMSATQLAWVLSAYPIPNDDVSLYGMSRDALVRFRDALIRRLTTTAFPR